MIYLQRVHDELLLAFLGTLAGIEEESLITIMWIIVFHHRFYMLRTDLISSSFALQRADIDIHSTPFQALIPTPAADSA